jgi:hypothetical protein
MTVNREAFADQYKRELADQSKRRKRLIEGAIANAALDPPDLRMTTEQLRYALEEVGRRWANAVNRIEARYDKGWRFLPCGDSPTRLFVRRVSK